MNESEMNSDVNSKIDIGLNVEANLNPIVSATPKAISTLLRLILRDKYTEASRLTMLSEAQNRVDVQKILEGKLTFNHESGSLVENSSLADKDTKSFREIIRDILQEEEISNLISCTVQAAENLKDDETIETKASPEFLNRWRNEAKFIAESTAQAIWGRILSEEVSSPNSISIRTLDVIKSMTRAEAEAFRDVCKFVFFGQHLIDSRSKESPEIEQRYALLADAGLITPFGVIRTGTNWPETKINFEENPTKVYFMRFGKLFIYLGADQVKEPPNFSYLTLTNAGKEMYRIISKEIEFDAMEISTFLTANTPTIRDMLKYTNYTNLENNQIDFNSIKAVFGEKSTSV